MTPNNIPEEYPKKTPHNIYKLIIDNTLVCSRTEENCNGDYCDDCIDKEPEDRICPSWMTCQQHTTEKPCSHHSPHTLRNGCDETCFYASGDCIQIPEFFQDEGGE